MCPSGDVLRTLVLILVLKILVYSICGLLFRTLPSREQPEPLKTLVPSCTGSYFPGARRVKQASLPSVSHSPPGLDLDGLQWRRDPHHRRDGSQVGASFTSRCIENQATVGIAYQQLSSS
jgi:hypothetical protein